MHVNFTGKKVNGKLLYDYIQQRNRGTQGFGFAFRTLADNRIIIHKRTEEEEAIDKLINCSSDFILFHHRFPTSTDNVTNACHPFEVKHNGRTFITVHNGVLYNSDKLKKRHNKMGFDYQSVQKDGRYNDSEALAHDLAIYLCKNKAKRSGKLESQGSIAFITIEIDDDRKPKKIFFGRNHSPLKISFSEEELVLGSETIGTDVVENKLYEFDVDQQVLSAEDLKIPVTQFYTSSDYIGFSKYDHGRMMRETRYFNDGEVTVVKTPKSKQRNEDEDAYPDYIKEMTDHELNEEFNLIENKISWYESSDKLEEKQEKRLSSLYIRLEQVWKELDERNEVKKNQLLLMSGEDDEANYTDFSSHVSSKTSAEVINEAVKKVLQEG